MIAAVADTHAGLWYLFANARLSQAAKKAFETAAANRHKIALSVISLAEIVLLDRERPVSSVGLRGVAEGAE